MPEASAGQLSSQTLSRCLGSSNSSTGDICALAAGGPTRSREDPVKSVAETIRRRIGWTGGEDGPVFSQHYSAVRGRLSAASVRAAPARQARSLSCRRQTPCEFVCGC